MLSLKPFLLLFLTVMMCYVMPANSSAQSSQGKSLADSLLQALPKAKDDTSKIKILYELAIAFATKDSTTALGYASKCMNLSKQNNWQQGVGLAYLAMGRIYYLTSNYAGSIQYSINSYSIFKSLGDEIRMARSLLNIGNDYNASGYYTKALEGEYAALKLYESIKNKKGIRAASHNVGVSYYYLMQFDKSIEHYKKSLAIDDALKDTFNIACDFDDIAIDFLHENKYDSANMYNLKALKLLEVLNVPPDLAAAYTNHANILMKLNNAKNAYDYYSRAFPLYKKLGSKHGMALTYGNFGGLYLALAKDSSAKFAVSSFMKMNKHKQLQQASDYFLKEIAMDKADGDLDGLMGGYLNQSEVAERLGNYRSALEYHKAYTLYKDSIFNDQNKQKLAAMETERLTEVKDQQIKILSQQKALETSEVKRQTLIRNIIIASVTAIGLLTALFIFLYNKRKKAKFDTQVMEVEMKALRAQMNPHFIFNSLHSINKYVVENDKENASSYLSKFASLMRLILENSREQEVPLEEDLHALDLYMQLESLRFKNKFTYCIETDTDIDKENTLIPPMLLQPFAENAILHGVQNQENGLIKISVHKQDEMICCVIEDNGNGSADSVVLGQNENKTHQSLGRKIINERLNVINQLKKVKAVVNVFDLKGADNKRGGMRVELMLPFEMAF